MGNQVCYSDAGPGQEAVVDQDKPELEKQGTTEETKQVKEVVKEKKDEIKEQIQEEETKKPVANEKKEAEPGEVGEAEQRVEEKDLTLGVGISQPSNTVDDISKTYDRKDNNDGGEQRPVEKFSEKRKARFAAYVGRLEPKKLQKFFERFDFARKPMNQEKVRLLFHALICLYLRKAEKIQDLPRDHITEGFSQELSTHFFDQHDLEEDDEVELQILISWISKKQLMKLYAMKKF